MDLAAIGAAGLGGIALVLLSGLVGLRAAVRARLASAYSLVPWTVALTGTLLCFSAMAPEGLRRDAALGLMALGALLALLGLFA